MDIKLVEDMDELRDDSKMTAKEYFDLVKGCRKNFEEKDLQDVYENCMYLANKAVITGQKKALSKLLFQMECLEKEKELLSLGINTYVHMDDVDYFIDEVRQKTVKIIELENYEREIPDDVVENVSKTRHLFDAYYVVFTDYTGKVERQVEKERRDRDPILFGVFRSKTRHSVVDRFYYLGDWVDDYCDLTLEKMVGEMQEEGRDIKKTIKMPKTIDELRDCLDEMDKRDKKV